ncbi:NADH dehydrogenase [ubiquinone] 1 alpha subcomplex assembly factor 2 isoform X2 [Hippoglossus hippoglossus]|uniref:NADH dehydrogenase [ubiquinone] 1 alpha subcomplex assembly factor 2 isoform X2 n=1 Tax=Hippoglossus hippoglossus TaxID=8267 RepID=UPI00148DE04B|nr:NADH dehydrogenase [ubiquinone] 1 alpha subcomplex assembly factor 2 isoform X2 [Hippoglossus hippoglossus]XP_035021058.1 NADH dehydrogenase [ubiquinone] 1 alpha subcomplex assembly factor 2 isoform X2 [Hippoglossus stenolepis]
MSRVASALRRTFGIVREHVGTDHLGNRYYVVPEQKTWTGRHVRAKRMVEAANPTEYEYIEGSIPMEWDAWIRGRRKEPPSVEELVKNESYRTQIKLKAKEVEEKDLALQAKEYEEGLVATPARTLAEGHAAATSFGKQEISEDPTSTANTFQPGSWMPTSKK